jgi:3-isopropylmalate/(R)-2-methylmalate dehydratase large subunit
MSEVAPQTPTPETMAQKLLAHAAGCSQVREGEILTVGVDLAFAHDSSGPRRWQPLLDSWGVGLWDPSRVAIVTDHYVPAVDVQSATILKTTREFVARHGIETFYDMQGICHLVLPEHGHMRPGAFVAGGDSHSTMGGAFGAYASGFGATDMAAIAATGETWLNVPRTIRVDLDGQWSSGIAAKDVMLLLCRELGMDNSFMVTEYGGTLVDAMTMEERMVLANMAAELGCEAGLVAADSTTLAYLEACGKPLTDGEAALCFRSDANAPFAKRHHIDVGTLAPQIAAPHSPENSDNVDVFKGTHVDQAYIGACVGAKIDDLRAAAEVLKGKQVAKGTRLLIAPASTNVTRLAIEDGTLGTLVNAGAILLPSGCGACAGLGAGILADGETCIASTNRNFKGRMGSGDALVYLGSPYSVAAAAIAGTIVDPREMLNG